MSAPAPEGFVEGALRGRRSGGRLLVLGIATLAASFLVAIAIGPAGAQPRPEALDPSLPPPLTIGRSLLILFARLMPFLPAGELSDAHVSIIFDVRLPRLTLMALTGAGLAAAGAAFQGLFRNPLADPAMVGVASGAGLGATLILAYGAPAGLLGLSSVPLAAFAGGVASVAFVTAIARVGRRTPVTTLLLAGVAVSSLNTAIATLWMLRSPELLQRAFNWLFGGYAGGGWTPVVIILPYLGIGLFALLSQARALNALQFDEEQAQQLGVPVERAKLVLLGGATMMTAAAVSFGGLLAFVGLIVPHTVRILGGPDHRRLIPFSAIGGAAFLTLADAASRTVFAPQELPVGVVTALVGAPFFLVLLRRLKRSVF